MITRPTVIPKGEPVEMQIDMVPVIELVQSKTQEYYFYEAHNWKCIILNYVTGDRFQKETVVFNNEFTSSVLSGTFEVSEHITGNLMIDSISIHDFDNGRMDIRRADLSDFLEELDIIFE